MSVSITSTRNDFIGNDSASSFSCTFPVEAATDVAGYVLNSLNAQTALVQGTDYTVSGVGGATGFTATLVSGGQNWLTSGGKLATGYALTFLRAQSLTQSTSIRNQGSYYPEVIERALDSIVLKAQQIQEKVSRAMLRPETESTAIGALPFKSQRQNALLGFDSNGDPVATSVGIGTALVSAYIQTLLDDANASAALTTLGVSTFIKTLLDDADAATARTTLGFAGTGGTAQEANLADGAVTPLKMAAKAKEGVLTNCQLSVTANNSTHQLTVALKTSAGADPSASDPIYVGLRSLTATTGSKNVRAITAAMSITVTSSIGTVSGATHNVFVYLIDSVAGGQELALSLSRFDDATLQSTTAIAGGTDGSALYSSTARTPAAIRLLGRFKISEAAAGTWDTAPTEIAILANGFQPSLRSEVVLHGGNTGSAHGSTNTKIRRFQTSEINTGNAITYADSATLGGTFTINEPGVYAISYTDVFTGAEFNTGLSRNSSQLTTSISGITVTDILVIGDFASGLFGTVTILTYLQAGDVIRAHTDGQPTSTSGLVKFRILQTLRG